MLRLQARKVRVVFRLALACFGLSAGPIVAHGQSCEAVKADTGAAPAFVVASVRAVPPGQRGLTNIGAYGLPRFSMRGVSLSLLLGFAYDVRPQNFLNAPKGLDDAVFDLEAKCEDDVALTYERLQPLLQQLLRERFGLVAHKGTKQTAGYALVVGKDGPKLTPTPAKDGAGAYIYRDQLRLTSGTLGTLAGMLASPARRPVIDETGMKGSYDITLKFAPLEDADSTLPSLFTALKEQLGLQLKPASVPVDTLVIERVNLVPAEN